MRKVRKTGEGKNTRGKTEREVRWLFEEVSGEKIEDCE